VTIGEKLTNSVFNVYVPFWRSATKLKNALLVIKTGMPLIKAKRDVNMIRHGESEMALFFVLNTFF
jgi:hypothetical protein